MYVLVRVGGVSYFSWSRRFLRGFLATIFQSVASFYRNVVAHEPGQTRVRAQPRQLGKRKWEDYLCFLLSAGDK
jgi:hypothetical protein